MAANTRQLPASGEILRLNEIMEKGEDGKAVRVMGRLKSHNYVKCHAVLSALDRNTNLTLDIDTKLVEPFNSKIGSVFQFIGELDYLCEGFTVIIQARVVRCVDGVDVTLYYRALDLQRKYLQER
ncbi:CST complex subunit TEN1-like [Glandiceps talaboti]